MARHKKRRYVPPPRDKTPPPSTPPTDTPPTDATPPDVPPPIEPEKPDPIQVDIDTSDKNRKLNQLFWMRVILAVAAGVSATFIFEPLEGEERRWASIGYMVILFLATVFIAKSMRIQLPASDRKKIVTQAIASYVFIYLFVWVMTTTIVHSLGAGSGSSLLR